jgi:putative spermidine/putrescine transport system permease protein
VGRLPGALSEEQGSGRAWRPELSHPVGIVLLLPAAILFLLLFFLPLLRVMQLSVTDPDLGVDRYRDFLNSDAQIRATLTTLKVSAIVTVVSLLLGSIVAWTLRTTRSRTLRALLWAGTIFPLWMSVVVLTYVFTIILQRRGIVNESLQFAGLTDEPVGLLYNTTSVVIAMVYSLTPFVILPLYTTLVNIDLDLVRAAESLGASRFRAVLSIVLPLSLPALLVAGSMVFVIALGFYITPALLGDPTQPFLAALIADQVYNQFDVAGAAAGSTILLLLAVAIVVVTVVIVGRERLRRTFA